MMKFRFRPITRADYPQLSKWLATPHVQLWWEDDKPDLEWIEENYGPVVDGTDPTKMFVVELAGRDIGFIQCYKSDDNPGYAEALQVPNNVGVDLYVGVPELVGQGIGSAMIKQFVQDIVIPNYPNQEAVVADPRVDNPASVRAFEKAGFTKGIIKSDDQGRPEQVMIFGY